MDPNRGQNRQKKASIDVVESPRSTSALGSISTRVMSSLPTRASVDLESQEISPLTSGTTSALTRPPNREFEQDFRPAGDQRDLDYQHQDADWWPNQSEPRHISSPRQAVQVNSREHDQDRGQDHPRQKPQGHHQEDQYSVSRGYHSPPSSAGMNIQHQVQPTERRYPVPSPLHQREQQQQQHRTHHSPGPEYDWSNPNSRHSPVQTHTQQWETPLAGVATMPSSRFHPYRPITADLDPRQSPQEGHPSHGPVVRSAHTQPRQTRQQQQHSQSHHQPQQPHSRHPGRHPQPYQHQKQQANDFHSQLQHGHHMVQQKDVELGRQQTTRATRQSVEAEYQRASRHSLAPQQAASTQAVSSRTTGYNPAYVNPPRVIGDAPSPTTISSYSPNNDLEAIFIEQSLMSHAPAQPPNHPQTTTPNMSFTVQQRPKSTANVTLTGSGTTATTAVIAETAATSKSAARGPRPGYSPRLRQGVGAEAPHTFGVRQESPSIPQLDGEWKSSSSSSRSTQPHHFDRYKKRPSSEDDSPVEDGCTPGMSYERDIRSVSTSEREQPLSYRQLHPTGPHPNVSSRSQFSASSPNLLPLRTIVIPSSGAPDERQSWDHTSDYDRAYHPPPTDRWPGVEPRRLSDESITGPGQISRGIVPVEVHRTLPGYDRSAQTTSAAAGSSSSFGNRPTQIGEEGYYGPHELKALYALWYSQQQQRRYPFDDRSSQYSRPVEYGDGSGRDDDRVQTSSSRQKSKELGRDVWPEERLYYEAESHHHHRPVERDTRPYTHESENNSSNNTSSAHVLGSSHARRDLDGTPMVDEDDDEMDVVDDGDDDEDDGEVDKDGQPLVINREGRDGSRRREHGDQRDGEFEEDSESSTGSQRRSTIADLAQAERSNTGNNNNGGAGPSSKPPLGRLRVQESKNHWCYICGKKFSRPSQLQTHSFTHNGLKPHQCDTCKKFFNVASNLKRHIRTHATTKRKSSRNGSNVFRSFAHRLPSKDSSGPGEKTKRGHDQPVVGAGGESQGTLSSSSTATQGREDPSSPAITYTFVSPRPLSPQIETLKWMDTETPLTGSSMMSAYQPRTQRSTTVSSSGGGSGRNPTRGRPAGTRGRSDSFSKSGINGHRTSSPLSSATSSSSNMTPTSGSSSAASATPGSSNTSGTASSDSSVSRLTPLPPTVTRPMAPPPRPESGVVSTPETVANARARALSIPSEAELAQRLEQAGNIGGGDAKTGHGDVL